MDSVKHLVWISYRLLRSRHGLSSYCGPGGAIPKLNLWFSCLNCSRLLTRFSGVSTRLTKSFCCSKRIITITATADGRSQSFASPQSSPGTCRVVCAHCDQEFLFNILHNSLAKCPHCGKISAVGNVYRHRQMKIYSVVAFILILITVLVIFGTCFLVAESGGIVALYIGLIAISVLALVRVIYFFRIKVSIVQSAV